eukprot:CAMPEP_0119197094 /NCGR_PEP_ID=MMETSP1316-20130426/12683_1 /TAXON_ID=41880 /ORGANISM="Pycnococcus provasolii, Strain RCC2336" /LENGTH=385 /DNA_ID=CAMNT_0007192865 /DNA_START=26 /DNA_END=1183 /DNA_ORIENTATION=-
MPKQSRQKPGIACNTTCAIGVVADLKAVYHNVVQNGISGFHLPVNATYEDGEEMLCKCHKEGAHLAELWHESVRASGAKVELAIHSSTCDRNMPGKHAEEIMLETGLPPNALCVVMVTRQVCDECLSSIKVATLGASTSLVCIQNVLGCKPSVFIVDADGASHSRQEIMPCPAIKQVHNNMVASQNASRRAANMKNALLHIARSTTTRSVVTRASSSSAATPSSTAVAAPSCTAAVAAPSSTAAAAAPSSTAAAATPSSTDAAGAFCGHCQGDIVKSHYIVNIRWEHPTKKGARMCQHCADWYNSYGFMPILVSRDGLLARLVHAPRNGRYFCPTVFTARFVEQRGIPMHAPHGTSAFDPNFDYAAYVAAKRRLADRIREHREHV